jgi:hypothetical protein
MECPQRRVLAARVYASSCGPASPSLDGLGNHPVGFLVKSDNPGLRRQEVYRTSADVSKVCHEETSRAALPSVYMACRCMLIYSVLRRALKWRLCRLPLETGEKAHVSANQAHYQY